jgi:hypothetical protein
MAPPRYRWQTIMQTVIGNATTAPPTLRHRRTTARGNQLRHQGTARALPLGHRQPCHHGTASPRPSTPPDATTIQSQRIVRERPSMPVIAAGDGRSDRDVEGAEIGPPSLPHSKNEAPGSALRPVVTIPSGPPRRRRSSEARRRCRALPPPCTPDAPKAQG